MFVVEHIRAGWAVTIDGERVPLVVYESQKAAERYAVKCAAQCGGTLCIIGDLTVG